MTPPPPPPALGPGEAPTISQALPPDGPGEAALVSVPGYEVRREVGRGGMGVVFEAVQLAANRPVALKVILAGRFATAAERARFRTEVEVASHLDHPHIVPVYDVGDHEGLPYFAMKLIEGGALSRWFADRHASRATASRADRRRLDREAVALLAKVARAVAHAHERGVLHRDLKPGNVLVDRA